MKLYTPGSWHAVLQESRLWNVSDDSKTMAALHAKGKAAQAPLAETVNRWTTRLRMGGTEDRQWV